MKGPVILLCVLIALALLMQVRLGCKAEYDQNGPVVYVRVGKLYLRIFPMNKKDKPRKPKEKKPKKEKKTKEPVPLSEKIGGALGYLEQLLPVVLDAVKYFGRKLSIDTLRLHLVAGSSDPADTALLYGRATAALGALWYPLTEAFDIKDGHAKVDLDFRVEEMKISGTAALSLKLGQILWFVFYFGVRALCRFLKERSRQTKERKLRKAV